MNFLNLYKNNFSTRSIITPTLRIINTVAMGMVITACGVKNPDLQGPAVITSVSKAEAPQAASVSDPKLNILFVVDNSGSMKPYQEKMAKNLEKFAETFFEFSRLEYRIGVVPVYDSRYLNDTTVYRSGLRKMNPLGELVRLKGLPSDVEQNQVFITRDTPNKIEVLKQTVEIGVQWGPEAEESFSPVIAVMNSAQNSEKNQGFYQEDAYLAIIFLTDADDVSPGWSADQFYRHLVQAKGGDRSKVLIAAAIPDRNNSSAQCSKDGQGPVDAIPRLLSASGGIVADLCSNDFGQRLASFGARLAREVTTQRIPIGFEPDLKTLAVCYGPATADSNLCGATEEIEKSAQLQRLKAGDLGFYYDNRPGKESIVISPTANIQRVNDGRIYIRAKKIDRNDLHNGRLEEK